MSIRPFLSDAAFEPHDIRAMSMALDDLCRAMNLPKTDSRAREIIATRIIELARRGERSPTRLRDRVLRESGAVEALPPEHRWSRP